jgi:AcrR family transcriptional regulator
MFMNDPQPATTRAARTRVASQERRAAEKQEVRTAILAAGEDLFLRVGYDGFALRQVAEAIGYTPTTIYRYFADKDDLLFTIADHGFLRFGQALQAAIVQLVDPLERLQALGRTYIAFGLGNPAQYQLMFLQRGDYMMGAQAGSHALRIESLMIVQQAAKAALDAGLIMAASPEEVADTLWALVHGIVALQLVMPSVTPERAAAMADLGISALLAGIAPRS